MVFFILSLLLLEGLAVVFPMILQEVAITASRQVEGADTNIMPVVWRGVMVLGFIILISAVHFLTEFLGALYADKYQANVRQKLYEKFSKLSKEEIEKIGASRILPTITNDSAWIKMYHRRLVTLVVFFPVAIIGSFIMLFTLGTYGWVYALFAFATIPFIGLFFWWNVRRVRRVIPQAVHAYDEYFFNIKEGIVGAKEIRILGKAEERSTEFATHVKHSRQQTLTIDRSLAMSAGFNAILFTLITIAIIVFAAMTNRSTGEMRVIVYLNTAIQYINRIWNGSHMMFGWFIDGLPRCQYTYKRLHKFYSVPEQVQEGGLKQLPNYTSNTLKFNNVSYRQPNGKARLNNINIEIPNGKFIGIAGGIQGGKGIMADMLLKMTSPTDGEITFNEIGLEQIHSPTWRREIISYCSDSPKFIPATVRDNIKLLAPDATDEQIMKVFKDLGAASYIKQFDNILDFEIKEGTNLSDGMRNLLSLVRGILKPAQIYVFNQCFEHVRHSYITRLMARLRREKKTAVFLSYDGSVCKLCDKIYVLHKGEISGEGTHAELIKDNKAYRDLHTSTLGVMVIEEEAEVDA